MPKYRDRSSEMHAGVTRRRIVRRRGIVIHTTEGFNSVDWLLFDAYLHGISVSADFHIDRVGNITQLTKPGWYAFHAGASMWRAFSGSDGTLNRSHVGVECENHTLSGENVTDAQYIALGALTVRLMSFHTFGLDGICLHRECALPAGRKSDPPVFDWPVFSRELLAPSVEASEYLFPAVLP